LASYYLNFVNDGNNSWTPAARRTGTASSAGTSLTIPWVTSTGNGANTSSNLLSAAFEAAYRAIVNSMSTTGVSDFPSFYVNLVDDGTGVFTPAARRGGTASSAGTALTIPWVESAGGGAGSAGLTKSALFSASFMAAIRAVLNDRSTNG
jgi:hypothetical protein